MSIRLQIYDLFIVYKTLLCLFLYILTQMLCACPPHVPFPCSRPLVFLPLGVLLSPYSFFLHIMQMLCILYAWYGCVCSFVYV